MSHPANWVRAITGAAMVCCLAFALRSSGEQKGGSGFASVDFKKLSAGYKAKDAVEMELKLMQTKFDAKLARRDNMPFLSEEDHKALDALEEKALKTDADTKKIKDLQDKAKTKSDEIQALRQKADKDLTEDNKKTLADADKMFRDAQARFTGMKEDLANQLAQYGNSQSDELMKKIRASIAKVAEQKGLAIVFNNEVALYAGLDITDAVVNELNKK
ncbi:MAG: OmpH family outer membrane protein [Chthonomonadales bacterium]